MLNLRYSQLSFYFNEFQISTKEKSRENPLDVTLIKNIIKYGKIINKRAFMLVYYKITCLFILYYKKPLL